MDGLELQQRLTHQGILIPIIFLTGHGDIPMSVGAINAGATDFLTKPVDAATLVQAVRAALQLAETRRQEIAETAALAARLATLTPREREVIKHVEAERTAQAALSLFAVRPAHPLLQWVKGPDPPAPSP